MIDEREDEEGLQMSFLDHLDELRKRLVQSVIAIAVAFFVCFYFSDKIYNFLAIPIKEQIRKANLRREVMGESKSGLDQLKEGEEFDYTFPRDMSIGGMRIPAGTTILAKAVRTPDNRLSARTVRPWVNNRAFMPGDTELPSVFGEGQFAPGFEEDKLVIRQVGGAFTLYMQVTLYTAVAFAIPFLLYQIWAFIAPGLYRHEKKYILPMLVMGTFFFITGATFAYKVAFPFACEYLLGLQEEGGFLTLIDAGDYLDLILLIMLGLGIVFQIPTVSYLLGRIGLVTPGMLWRAWRYAAVAIIIIAAIITPTADALNLAIFAVPMMGLYFLSILIVWLFGKPRRSDEEVAALAHSK